TTGRRGRARRRARRRWSWRDPISSRSILPRRPQHLVGVALERPAVEAAHHLVPREPGGAQQQLHLEAVGPAQRDPVLVHGAGVAASVGLAQLHLGAQRLPYAIVLALDGDMRHGQAGLGMGELPYDALIFAGLDDAPEARVEEI